jgi:hypothetical protein
VPAGSVLATSKCTPSGEAATWPAETFMPESEQDTFSSETSEVVGLLVTLGVAVGVLAEQLDSRTAAPRARGTVTLNPSTGPPRVSQ